MVEERKRLRVLEGSRGPTGFGLDDNVKTRCSMGFGLHAV